MQLILKQSVKRQMRRVGLLASYAMSRLRFSYRCTTFNLCILSMLIAVSQADNEGESLGLLCGR